MGDCVSNSQELALRSTIGPWQMFQLAAREYELSREESDEKWVPENQLWLANGPESGQEIPGVQVTNERTLSDVDNVIRKPNPRSTPGVPIWLFDCVVSEVVGEKSMSHQKILS